MAVDKLVDSTKLDACLDAEAGAIRAKTGGSADIPFDFANNKGFADAIAAIPSGGGLDDYFTPVNCVTIRNDATYGRSNGFVIPDAIWNVVKKIEIKFKLANPNASHFVWVSGGVPGVQPFIDKTSGSPSASISVITNETVDDIIHYVLSLNATNTSKFWIGSWSDATYSQTAAYYELKMWDVNDNLIVDLQPSVSVNGNLASFLNKISGIFYTPTTSFIEGEVLS